jgi:5-methyltetrahydrofolate--homocysteine methyltransferase
MLALAWQVKPSSDEAKRIKDDSKEILDNPVYRDVFEKAISAVVGLFSVTSKNEDVIVLDENKKEIATLYFMRQQEVNKNGQTLSLADYVAESGDTMGLFVATVGKEIDILKQKFKNDDDDYRVLLVSMLADRLAEATSEYLEACVKQDYWTMGEHKLIRPANGYPSAPDHSEKETIFKILDAEEHLGIKLTESYAMDPVSSVCGYYFADKDPHYFSLSTISDKQFENYAERKGKDKEELKKVFAGTLNKE